MAAVEAQLGEKLRIKLIEQAIELYTLLIRLCNNDFEARQEDTKKHRIFETE